MVLCFVSLLSLGNPHNTVDLNFKSMTLSLRYKKMVKHNSNHQQAMDKIDIVTKESTATWSNVWGISKLCIKPLLEWTQFRSQPSLLSLFVYTFIVCFSLLGNVLFPVKRYTQKVLSITTRTKVCYQPV